jgi:hypothetical protein
LHPAFLKEKTDTEKQSKQKVEDTSLEWRQYCLDPLYTNYNQVVQNLLKNGSRTSPPNTLNSNAAYAQAAGGAFRQPINSNASYFQQEQCQQFSFYEGYSPVPISPSCFFNASSSNVTSGSFTFYFVLLFYTFQSLKNIKRHYDTFEYLILLLFFCKYSDGLNFLLLYYNYFRKYNSCIYTYLKF